MLLITLLPLLLTFVFLYFAYKALRQKRWFKFSRKCLAAGLCLSLTALLTAICLNFYTYKKLLSAELVATISCQQVAPMTYQLTLEEANGVSTYYFLRGDEWELNAKVLRWQGWAQLIGVKNYFRLERLNSRYQKIEQARKIPPTVYVLNANPGIDIWQLAKQHQDHLPWLDAYYGNAVYMPLADGAEYGVWFSQNSLISKPVNEAAKTALKHWG